MPAPAPTGNFLPTSFIAIAEALRDRVTSKGVCTQTQFLITTLDPEDVPHLTGDFDLVFSIGSEQPDVRVIDGAGRTVNKRQRAATLSVRSRLLLDVLGQDETHLLDLGSGHVQLEDSVCNALEIYQPTNPAGDWLVTAPVRLGRLGKAKREKQHPGWLVSTWELEIPYVRALDTEIS